jgi:transcriptional regulator with XRE-family HTH domain
MSRYIPAALKAARLAAGLTAEQSAEHLGCPASVLAMYEGGRLILLRRSLRGWPRRTAAA